MYPQPDQQCPNIKGGPSPHNRRPLRIILTLLITNVLVDLALDDLAGFDIFNAEESLFQHLLTQQQLEQAVESVASDDTEPVLSIELV